MNLYEYIDTLKNKRVCVIGIGVSNTPLIRLLAVSGIDVTACDKRTREQLGAVGDDLESVGAKFKLGEDYLSNLDFDVIFRTPGLMPFDPHLEEAVSKGAVLTSEMEVFFSLCPCRTIAVTGSDGKTTTTTVISEFLKAAGYTVHIGGNIGHPLLCELPSFKESDFAVLELSSFQLHSMFCRPDIAVITNISPNHLDKHKDYDDYIDAKAFIFRNQDPDGILVLNRNNEFSPRYAAQAKGNIRYFSHLSRVENGTFFEDGKVYIARNGVNTYVMDADDIRIPGNHNLQNYLTAIAAVYDLVPPEICRKVAREFAGVEHRLETVRVYRGVTVINDSIGTSPSRTAAGLRSLRTRPILIAGGYDKHIPFDTLGDDICLYAKEVFITGATAEKIRQAIVNSKYYPEHPVKYTVIDDFKETVLAAVSAAEPGDIVLLSPACAAFDRFANFAERGRYFKKIIMELEDENI